MKMKTIKLLTACCLTMCLVMACGGISVKGENGQTYDSYQECCAALDFQAAHQFLAKMEKAENEDYSSAKDYIFKQEALYLMSQGTEEASSRLIYLLAEYQVLGQPPTSNGKYYREEYNAVKKYIEEIARYNNLCNSVLDMAITHGD